MVVTGTDAVVDFAADADSRGDDARVVVRPDHWLASLVLAPVTGFASVVTTCLDTDWGVLAVGTAKERQRIL